MSRGQEGRVRKAEARRRSPADDRIPVYVEDEASQRLDAQAEIDTPCAKWLREDDREACEPAEAETAPRAKVE